MLAETSWPEAAVAIAGVVLVTTILTVVVWQAMSTWRARMSVARESAHRELAANATDAQERTAVALEALLGEVQSLRERTTAVERMLNEVG